MIRREVLCLFLGFCLFGCQQQAEISEIEADKEKAVVADSEVKEFMEIMDTTKRVRKETSLVSIYDDTQRSEMISEGRWFFSALNFKTGQISYYDKYGNFLGERKIR